MSNMVDNSAILDNSKSGLASPFRSIRLRQRMEARRNVTSMDQRYGPIERVSADNFSSVVAAAANAGNNNNKLSEEIDELIKRQKAELKVDFDQAEKCCKKTPIKTSHPSETPIPSHHKLKQGPVFSSGDLDGAEDEENGEWAHDDSFISENIEEAPVSVINPSSIRTGLAKGATSGKLP